MDERRQCLAIPEIAGQTEIVGGLSQRRIDLRDLLFVQSRWTAGTLPFHEPHQTLLLESTDPVSNGAGRIAKQRGHLICTYALGDQQEPVESMIITGLWRSTDLILQR